MHELRAAIVVDDGDRPGHRVASGCVFRGQKVVGAKDCRLRDCDGQRRAGRRATRCKVAIIPLGGTACRDGSVRIGTIDECCRDRLLIIIEPTGLLVGWVTAARVIDVCDGQQLRILIKEGNCTELNAVVPAGAYAREDESVRRAAGKERACRTETRSLWSLSLR